MHNLSKLDEFYKKLYLYISQRKMTYLIDLRNKYSPVNINSQNNKVMVMPTRKIGPAIKGVKLLIKFEEGRCGFLIENHKLLISNIKMDLSYDLKIEETKNGYFIWWKTSIIYPENDFDSQKRNVEYLLDSVALKIRFYRQTLSYSIIENS